jgi:hypothetical protein
MMRLESYRGEGKDEGRGSTARRPSGRRPQAPSTKHLRLQLHAVSDWPWQLVTVAEQEPLTSDDVHCRTQSTQALITVNALSRWYLGTSSTAGHSNTRHRLKCFPAVPKYFKLPCGTPAAVSRRPLNLLSVCLHVDRQTHHPLI